MMVFSYGPLENNNLFVTSGNIIQERDMAVHEFQVGNAVRPENFFDRRVIRERVIKRIMTGQSCAVVGDPRSGKTSLLQNLKSKECQVYFQQSPRRFVFCFLDSFLLKTDITPAELWQQVFGGLARRIAGDSQYASLLAAYQDCEKHGMGSFDLECLMQNIEESGWQVVLLLDEFDYVLSLPGLHNSEFYGCLRSLASRFGTAFTVVIASRQSLSKLNEETQMYSQKGSPFFNFMLEYDLEPFTEKDTDAFLEQSCPDFKQSERKMIFQITGGHPYLVQAGGQAMVDTVQGTDVFLSTQERYEKVSSSIYDLVDETLSLTWDLWSPENQKVFAIIALNEYPTILEQVKFNLAALTGALAGYPQEIRYLLKRGYIKSDPALPGGYRINGQVFLWWIGNMLKKSLTERGSALGHALVRYRFFGLISGRELEQFNRAVSKIGQVFQDGMKVAIQASVEAMIDTIH
jgi:hypothetical protein